MVDNFNLIGYLKKNILLNESVDSEPWDLNVKDYVDIRSWEKARNAKYAKNKVDFKDIKPGGYYIVFGFDGQLWKKSTKEPNRAFFVRNIGGKYASAGTNVYVKLNKSAASGAYQGERVADTAQVYPVIM